MIPSVKYNEHYYCLLENRYVISEMPKISEAEFREKFAHCKIRIPNSGIGELVQKQLITGGIYWVYGDKEQIMCTESKYYYIYPEQEGGVPCIHCDFTTDEYAEKRFQQKMLKEVTAKDILKYDIVLNYKEADMKKNTPRYSVKIGKDEFRKKFAKCKMHIPNADTRRAVQEQLFRADIHWPNGSYCTWIDDDFVDLYVRPNDNEELRLYSGYNREAHYKYKYKSINLPEVNAEDVLKYCIIPDFKRVRFYSWHKTGLINELYLLPTISFYWNHKYWGVNLFWLRFYVGVDLIKRKL